MSVAVYPRLNELLRARGMSVAELERMVQRRFGLSVNLKTLYRLTSPEPVRRADLEIAGAVASVLGVGLGDLFDVHAVAVGALGEEPDVLGPATARRLAELFDISSRGELSADERRQLETLVREYGLQLHEMRVQEYARQQHLSPDEARREVASSLERSVAWWEEFEADPDQRAVIVRDAKRRRQPASKT